MATINPGLHLLIRDAHSVQFGVGRESRILSGLSPAEQDLLQLLSEGVPDADLPGLAHTYGLTPARTRNFLASLAGLLLPDEAPPGGTFRDERRLPERAALLGLQHLDYGQALARRAAAVVHVSGLGRTGAALALALVAAGVGTLFLADDRPVTAVDVCPGGYGPQEVGRVRSVAVRRRALAVDPLAQIHVQHTATGRHPDPGYPDLAIVVAQEVLSVAAAGLLLSRGRPHLIVLVRERGGSVGPLVIPGETACSECVERTRAAHEPHWHALHEQLTLPPSLIEGRAGWRQPTVGLESATLAPALAGTAAAQAIAFLDALDRPSSWSAVLTFDAGSGGWERTAVPRHPDCSCQWQDQALATIARTDSP